MAEKMEVTAPSVKSWRLLKFINDPGGLRIRLVKRYAIEMISLFLIDIKVVDRWAECSKDRIS